MDKYLSTPSGKLQYFTSMNQSHTFSLLGGKNQCIHTFKNNCWDVSLWVVLVKGLSSIWARNEVVASKVDQDGVQVFADDTSLGGSNWKKKETTREEIELVSNLRDASMVWNQMDLLKAAVPHEPSEKYKVAGIFL